MAVARWHPLVALALLWSIVATRALPARAEMRPLQVNGERLLVVAPHPDDETLAAGGLIQRVLATGGSVRVVLLTAGDGYVEAVVHESGSLRPRPAEYIAYGERRLREARAAARVLGNGRIRLQVLGFPDGGLEPLLQAHWWRTRPERSQTTRANDPPYNEALEPDVPYDGEDLRRELVTILRETRPTIVVLPDPLDKHPDHRAAGLFTLLAIDDWLTSERLGRGAMPLVLAYLVHWPDWPSARVEAPLELPENLRVAGAEETQLVLTENELGVKRMALAKHASQMQELPHLLTLFLRGTEPFTVLPPDEVDRVGDVIESHMPARHPPRTRPQPSSVSPHAPQQKDAGEHR